MPVKLSKIVATFLGVFFLFVGFSSRANAAARNCSFYSENLKIEDVIANPQFVLNTGSALAGDFVLDLATGANWKTNCECAVAIQNLGDDRSAEKINALYQGDPACAKLAAAPGGGVKAFALISSKLKNTPSDFISFDAYASNVLNQSIIGKKAYALTGWASISSGVLEAWIKMRNIAIVLFVLIIVVVGFMIMFKKKIDPQTVVTLQAAIPNIAISLILIIFSFPIVTLINSFASTISAATDNMFGVMQPAGWPTLFGGLGTVSIIGAIVAIILTANVWILIAAIMAGIILLPLTFAFIYFIFVWVKVLTKMTFSVVFAPFILLMAAVPGNEKMALNWLKSVVALGLTFPALWALYSFGLFMLGQVFVGGGGPMGGLVAGLVSISIMFSVGKVPNAINAALGVEDLLPSSPPPRKK